jgi:anti-anti-sigma factor
MSTAAEETSDAHLICTVTRIENTICVTVIGQLDLVIEDQLTEVVSEAASTPEVVALHFDLSAVTFIDSSGLRGLIQSSHMALDRDLTFTVEFTEKGPVARLLDLTGLREQFTQAPLSAQSEAQREPA